VPAAAPAEPTRLASLDLEERPPPRRARGGVPGWVWIGVGAAVLVGGVFGTYLFWTRGRTDVPPTALGNYEF
jgi:hypothetical protein